MLGSVRPVLLAAREAVLDIEHRYDGYDADLIDGLTQALKILESEPSSRGQNRATEELIKKFAAGLASKIGE